MNSTLAFFSPSPLVSIGQRGSGLPLAPWALLLCWWSPELETHSNVFSFVEKQELEGKCLLGASTINTP